MLRPQTTVAPSKQLGAPAAIMFLAGIALVLFALRGLDEKHGLFGNKLAPASDTTSTTSTDTSRVNSAVQGLTDVAGNPIPANNVNTVPKQIQPHIIPVRNG